MEQLYRELLEEALALFDGAHKLCDKVGTDEWAWKLQALEALQGGPSPVRSEPAASKECSEIREGAR
jgi:hypothetical protein